MNRNLHIIGGGNQTSRLIRSSIPADVKVVSSQLLRNTLMKSADPSRIPCVVTITQQDHQTITVYCNGVPHTETFVAYYWDKIEVAVTADQGYEAGTANIDSTVIKTDISVEASAPKITYYDKYLSFSADHTYHTTDSHDWGSQGYTNKMGSCSDPSFCNYFYYHWSSGSSNNGTSIGLNLSHFSYWTIIDCSYFGNITTASASFLRSTTVGRWLYGLIPKSGRYSCTFRVYG